jgi:hypothetical protein
MDGEFSVYQFFPDESYEEVLRFTDAKTAVETAKRLTESLGGRLGTTRRIIITDGGDFTCFEWKHGEGVTFPPRDPTPTKADPC